MPKWLPKRKDYHPGGYVPFHQRESYLELEERLPSILADLRDDPVTGYPLPVDWTEAVKQEYRDLIPPRERCRSCHSSEFDVSGKCVYCRQYQS